MMLASGAALERKPQPVPAAGDDENKESAKDRDPMLRRTPGIGSKDRQRKSPIISSPKIGSTRARSPHRVFLIGALGLIPLPRPWRRPTSSVP